MSDIPTITPVELRSADPVAADSTEPQAYPATGQPFQTMKPDQLVPFTNEELEKATAQNMIALARNIMLLMHNFKKSPTASGIGLAGCLAVIADIVWPLITGGEKLPENIATYLKIGGGAVAFGLGCIAVFKGKSDPFTALTSAPNPQTKA